MSKSPAGAPKRAAVGLLAGALAVFGIALAPSAGAVEEAVADRVAGATRYGTAAAVATEAYPDGNDCVIVATGENFPDALAASGLAGADGCPILLVQRDTIPEETSAAIEELGASSATIVGGSAAVSEGVEDGLRDELGLTVDRIAGATRYDTACDIAGAIGDTATVVVASGEVAADALSAGPIAANLPASIALVTQNAIPACSEDILAGATEVLIAGGTARISDDNEAAIEDASSDADAERLAGQNRQETSVDIADYEVETLGWAPTAVLLAAPSAPNSDFSPDALVSGALGGLLEAPNLIVTSVDELGPAGDFIDAHSDTITEAFCIGGTAVISEDLCDAAEAAAQNVENDDDGTPTNQTVTNRPELVSANIVETRTVAASTATRPPGTYVRYCFDEAITGATPAAGFFHLYNADGTRFTGDVTAGVGGQSFTSGLTSTDNKCAEIHFGGATGATLDTAAEAAALTLATVERGAATGQTGAGGDTSIEGDAPLTPASSTPAAAGVTAAPDLLSVGNFKAGSTGDLTSVDFTFDQAAFVQNTTGFHIVGSDGTTYLCNASTSTSAPSGQAAPGGSGTTIVTASCEEPAGFPGNFAAANFARGYVDAGAVAATSTPTSPNALQAANVVDGAAGVTSNPDLTAVIFAPDAAIGSDVVAFFYDEAVGATGTIVQGRHFIYDTAGNEVTAQLGCGRSGDDNKVVTCAFTDGQLAGANYVGGNVRAGAVEAADNAGRNAADEEGTSPSAGPSATTSRTDGPDLISVAITRGTNIFGNPTATATFSFDEDTANTASAATTSDAAAGGNSSGAAENVILGLLHLYTSDGIRLDCVSLSGNAGTAQDSAVLAARSEDTDHQVTCTNFAVGGTGGSSAAVAAPAATVTQVGNSVVGTVEYGAVDDQAAGGDTNPEGAEVATGSGGTAST